jgi:hypothetical protein
MIFFFSSKIGPKDSKFGILNSQRRHNDNQLHQIRIQSLSFTTVPSESSTSGNFWIKTAFSGPLPKNSIEILSQKSTNRSNSSSFRGFKRNFPWSHSPDPIQKDSGKNLAKVVKRTDEHGLAQASCRYGPDDSHGVAKSRNSSGDSIQTNSFFSVFSHSKHTSGSNLSSSSNTPNSMSSGTMRTDGHGLAQASCRYGPDDSHGVATPVTNSGAFPSSSSISNSNSQSVQIPGHLNIDDSTQADIIATRKNTWLQYKIFINDNTKYRTARTAESLSSALMENIKRTEGHGLVPASCLEGHDYSPGVATTENPSGASTSSLPPKLLACSHSEHISGNTDNVISTGGTANKKDHPSDETTLLQTLASDTETSTCTLTNIQLTHSLTQVTKQKALDYIVTLDKATVHTLLRHKISEFSLFPSVVNAVTKQILGDSRDLLNKYLCNAMTLNLRANLLVEAACHYRQKSELRTKGEHVLTVDLRKVLDTIDELVYQEQELLSSEDASLDDTVHHLVPNLRRRILNMPGVTRKCVDEIMERIGWLTVSMQMDLCEDTGTELTEYVKMVMGQLRERDPDLFRFGLRDSLTTIGLGKIAATISDRILEDTYYSSLIDKLLHDWQLLRSAAATVMPAIITEVVIRALDDIGMRRASGNLGPKLVKSLPLNTLCKLLQDNDKLRNTASAMDTSARNSTDAQRRLACNNLLEVTAEAEDKPTTTWNYFDQLLPRKVGDVIHRPSLAKPHDLCDNFPALPGNEGVFSAQPAWDTVRVSHSERISAHYVSVTGHPLTYTGYMDPYAYADIDNQSTHSAQYTQALADMHARSHVRPIADKSPITFPVDISRKHKVAQTQAYGLVGSERARKRKASPSAERVTATTTGVQSFRPILASLSPRLAHPSYYAPLWVEEWQGRDDPFDVLHFMPRNNFVCARKKTKLHKVIDDGWEDFLRENSPAPSNYVQTTGQSAPVINPVKQRRHIKLRQVNRSQRVHTTIEDLCQRAHLYSGIKTAKGRTKQLRKSIVLETAIHPKAQRKRQRGPSDNCNKTHAADQPYTKVPNILSVQSTSSISATSLQHESDYDYERHSTQHSTTLDAGVSLDMCPITSTDNIAKETQDDSTAMVPTNLGENLQIQPRVDTRDQLQTQLAAECVSLVSLTRGTINMGIKTAHGMTECRQKVIATDGAKYPLINTKDDLNRKRGHNDRLLWAPANSNEASTRMPSRTLGLHNYSAKESDVLRPAEFPAITIATLDNNKSSVSTISTGIRLHASREAHTHKKAVFSQRTGLTRYPARPFTTHIGSTTPCTVASTASFPTTELMPCSQLTTDQQFAQILSLCQTSMTDTRGLCTALSNDRDTQAQINIDLQNSLAKVHAAINSFTSMLRTCPPEATTNSILHCPIAQGSFVIPTSDTTPFTNSLVEGLGHEDKPTHDPASSDTEFAQILTLCQKGIIETRGVRLELSNNRDTQARINTDLQNSLARAHAAIDAFTSTLYQ